MNPKHDAPSPQIPHSTRQPHLPAQAHQKSQAAQIPLSPALQMVNAAPPELLSPAHLLTLQRTVGNRAVTNLVQARRSAASPGLIQRRGDKIPQVKDLSEEAPSGFAFGGSTYKHILDKVGEYHQLGDQDFAGQLQKLQELETLIAAWEEKHPGPKNKNEAEAKRRTVVEWLKVIVPLEQAFVQGQATSTPFTDQTATLIENQKLGGAMNKLDVITYGGLNIQGGAPTRGTGQFETVFKPQQHFDPLRAAGYTYTGSNAGIPTVNPKFNERSLAMYKIDQLLGADVIPPTFRAIHEGQGGIVMEKIKGITAGRLIEDIQWPAGMDVEAKKAWWRTNPASPRNLDPLLRRSMSKLTLLDYICGQTDRHIGNIMLQTDEQGNYTGVKGIDNDVAFGKNYDPESGYEPETSEREITLKYRQQIVAGEMPGELKEIDRPFALRIIALANQPELIQKAVQDLLAPTEIMAMIKRLNALRNFLQGLIDANSPLLTQEEPIASPQSKQKKKKKGKKIPVVSNPAPPVEERVGG